VYNSVADATIYVKFVHNSWDYCSDGEIEKSKQVRYVSHFLSGTALKYYTVVVLRSSSEWSLSKFFKGLFDYCFPKNFRQMQRTELRRCTQGSSLVHEYAHKLLVYFKIIGTIGKSEQVDKLWNGLRCDIQSQLWKAYLNPETASWEKVVEVAEIIEKAES
ncbi:hypothetical protein JAAARDRAFT_90988, partial [Jaapia argillacea MUCL 33604]